MKKRGFILIALFILLLIAGYLILFLLPTRTGPDIILISVDTLRADHLGCYGNTRVKTPHIDGLAREGVLFKNHFTVVPSTLASHAALFAGRYPREIGVPSNGYILPGEVLTLPQVLKTIGYQTFGYVSAYCLSSDFNFHSGFDYFDERFNIRIPMMQNFRKAAELNQALFATLEEKLSSRKSLFLFVHYFDPHWPYSPPEPYRSQYTEGYKGEVEGSLDDIFEARKRLHSSALSISKKEYAELHSRLGHGALSQEEIKRIYSRYTSPAPDEDSIQLAHLHEGEIAYTDYHIGALLEKLNSLGRLEDSIVIFTSDHGETFWEHREFFSHGHECYDTTLHIPLIIRSPNRLPQNEEIQSLTRSIDLVPTILELIGKQCPPGLSGESLYTEMKGRQAKQKERVLFAESSQPHYTWVERKQNWTNQWKTRCLRTLNWKYTYTPYLANRMELYNLKKDFSEKENLLEQSMEGPGLINKKRQELHQALLQWDTKTNWSKPKKKTGKSIEKLKSLGYFR